jgi:hypothetical protein
MQYQEQVCEKIEECTEPRKERKVFSSAAGGIKTAETCKTCGKVIPNKSTKS